MIECLVEEIGDAIQELLRRKITDDETARYCTECHEHYGKCRLKG